MKTLIVTLITLLAACDTPNPEPGSMKSQTGLQVLKAPGTSEAPDTAKKDYITVNDDVVAQAIASVEVNRAGETFVDGLRLLEVTPLAHDSYQGPMGPANDGVVFFDKRPESDTNLMGWVIGNDDDQVKAWRFFHQTSGAPTVKEVFFEDIYKDGFPDILVAVSVGADSPPRTATIAFVYDQASDQFIAKPDLFDGPLNTGSEVHDALRRQGLVR